MTSLLEIEKRWIGKLIRYNFPQTRIGFIEEQLSTTSKFNKNMLWFEKMNSYLKTSPVIQYKEFNHLYEHGDIVLLLDIEERKALGGRIYRLYQTLKGEKNVYFILSEGSGELSMYFQLVSFTDV